MRRLLRGWVRGAAAESTGRPRSADSGPAHGPGRRRDARLAPPWTSTSPTIRSRSSDGARELLDGARLARRRCAPTPTPAPRTTPRCGRRWPTRAGSAIEVPEDAGRRRARHGRGRGARARSSAATRRRRRSCPTVLAIDAFRAAGDDAWVERLVAGDALACVAWDPAAPVPYAPSADVAVVLRRRRRVRDGASTERPARQPAMDLTRELGWLAFDPARARQHRRRRRPRRACSIAARRSPSADLLGSASRALDLAVEHAKDRVQFGRPIGSFQAVKHRCADMLVDVEGMRSTVYWAAWCIGADDRRSARRGVDREDVVLRRVEARDELGAPGARRHRLHLGARPALLHEARPARPARVRRRVASTGPGSRRCCARGSRPARASCEVRRAARRRRVERVGSAGARRDRARAGHAVRPRGEGRQRGLRVASAPRGDAGFDRVPVPPTYTFVMASAGAFPDLQPEGGTGSMYATAGSTATPRARSRVTGCSCTASSTSRITGRCASATCSKAGCARRSRSRVKRGAARWKSPTSRRRGPTSTASRSSTSASCRSSSRTSDAPTRAEEPAGRARPGGAARTRPAGAC